MGLDKALKAADERPGSGIKGLRSARQIEGTFTCVLESVDEDITTSTKAEGVFLTFRILEGTSKKGNLGDDEVLMDKLFFNQDGGWTVHQERLLKLAEVFDPPHYSAVFFGGSPLIRAMEIIRKSVGKQVEVTTKWITGVRTPYMKFSYHDAG